MHADIVIVAKTTTPQLRQMTENCLVSLASSEPLMQYRPWLVETQPDSPDYPYCWMVRPEPEPLNYNRYLNVGAARGVGEIIVFCNNDLLFQPGWLTSLFQVFDAHPELATLGTKSPGYQPQEGFQSGLHRGWRTCFEFSGWCFAMRRAVWQALDGLSEQFQFWGSDCMTVIQLQRAGYQHALNADSLVTHLYSQSHQILPPDELHRVTEGEIPGVLEERRRLACLLSGVPPHTPIGAAGCP